MIGEEIFNLQSSLRQFYVRVCVGFVVLSSLSAYFQLYRWRNPEHPRKPDLL